MKHQMTHLTPYLQPIQTWTTSSMLSSKYCYTSGGIDISHGDRLQGTWTHNSTQQPNESGQPCL